MSLYSMEFEIPMISLFFILMLIIFYLLKNSINSLENKIFKIILGASFLEILLDFYIHLICSVKPFDVIVSLPYYNLFNILNKFIVISFIAIFESLFLYTLIITYGKKIIKNKKLIIVLSVINLVSLGLLFFTKIVIVDAKTAANVTGSTPMLGYIMIAFYLSASLFVTIKNFKKIDHRYLPIILIFVVLILCYLATLFWPGIILYDFAITVLCYLMYFTIENPDTKMLKEMHDAKEISDNANEEKTLFLYNMTQEIRNTTKNIDTHADTILDSDSLDIDKDSARNIKGETSKFRTMTNDILDVSAIDASNIKIYNSKYDLKLLLRTLISSYNDICKNKAINFRTNIEHNIPNTLYGDSINLKKVISLLLSYSVSNTNKGFVEFNVNTIIKNDICRLVITIEDSSMGIRSDELERVKIDNKNISQAYKMLTVMNGTMILTSNYGIGTKIKIVLDQRIDLEDKEEKKYYEVYNDKKILVVDDNESSIKIIEKLLKGTDIVIESVLTGREALAKIKIKNRYDLILLDESLSQISGEELLKKFKSFRNFNIPVILLSKDNKYEYNEEYIKMGFNDILIKPLKKDELIKIINNYIKRDEL